MTMDYETIKITDIKPAEYNPRQISDDNMDKLQNSLEMFGLVDPIIINLKNENTIIGGHQRFRILLENDDLDELYLLRLGDIGWVFDNDDLKVEDENMEKLLNINLNQTNLMGEWDNERLKLIISDLQLEDIDLSLTGFEDFELDERLSSNEFDLNNSFNGLDRSYDENHTNDKSSYEPTVKRGDIYKLGENFLLCEDYLNPDKLFTYQNYFGILPEDLEENKALLETLKRHNSALILINQENQKYTIIEDDEYICQEILDDYEEITGNKPMKL